MMAVPTQAPNPRACAVPTCSDLHLEDETPVAHVRYVDGDDHLQLQLQLGGDHKTFRRDVTETLDKLRHRLAIQANAAAELVHGNRARKERNKADPRHRQSPSVCVRFFTATDEEIVGSEELVGDALMRTDRIVIGDSTFAVVHNQPTVTSVKVISPLLSGIPIVPMPETAFCSPDDCAWRWYRVDSATGAETLVGVERRFVPTHHDVGVCFRVECRAPRVDSRFAHESTAETVTTPITTAPDRSMFTERRRLGATRAGSSGDDRGAFRVMTYNVLFDGYTSSLATAKTDLFPYAPREVLAEMYRAQLVFQEIAESNADLVCTQEMGQHVFHSFFAPMLAPLGYRAVYTGKTGSTHEGCAVFVRTDCFEVVETHELAVSEAALRSDDPGVAVLLANFPELRKGLEKIPSVAQLLVLRDVRTVGAPRLVVLANTHLYYREDADMIRAVQAIALVRVLETLSGELTATTARAVAVVVCGDLNAVPDSAAVRFLLDGALDATHRHWRELGGFRWQRRDDDNGMEEEEEEQNEAAAMNPASTCDTRIAHALALASACGLPAFTNFAGSFVATLDYILLSDAALAVVRPFPLFSRADVSAEVALPATAFPSDHVALLADLRWR